MYNKSFWASRDNRFVIIKKYHSFRVQPGSPNVKEKRARRKGETTLKQEEINAKIKRDRLERVLLDNFEAGDCYLTCTYKETPESVEQIKDDWSRFKRKLKSLFQRKLEKPLKFVAILEHLHGGGRAHGHMLIPAIPKETIKAIKKYWPYGNVEIKTYGGELLDAHRLAGYFTKESVARFSSGIQSSRNLIRTEPKKTVVTKSETFSEKMVAPAGYHVVKELSYISYTDEGYPCMKMFLERDEEEDDKRKRKRTG